MRDRHSLAALYDRHAARLYAIAFRITGDRDAAADALEEAFLMMSRADPDDPAHYLLRATRDAALARQTQPRSTAVLANVGTSKEMVEEAWFTGASVSELASRYGLAEEQTRAMLCDGMSALRAQFAGSK
jgi:DNA-directed RNA polymerase specialized sigma24 family protein